MLNQPLWLRDFAAYNFQVIVLVMAGSTLPFLFRLRLPGVRLAYWQALLAVCLLLPLIQPWHPDLLSLDEMGLTGHAGVTLGPAVTTPAGWSLAEVIFLILIAGVLLRVLWVVLGMWRLSMHRRRARRMEKIKAPIQEVQRRVAVRPDFYLSHDLTSPATFGLRKPAVLLPNRFFALPPPMQKAIACHELLHVARRHWAWNMVEEFILSLLWFQPAVWWVIRNIRLSREQTVDAAVIRLTESRRAYLGALLEMAQHKSTPRSIPAPLFLHEGQLAQRVALMMKEVSMSRPRLIATLFVAAAVLLLTGWASARAFPLKTSAPPGTEINSPETQTAKMTKSEAKIAVSAGSATFPWTQNRVPHEVDVKTLKRVHTVMPHYPPEAKKAGIQGSIVLEVTIDSKGKVTDVRLLSGPPELVKASVEAVKQWRYAPSPLLPARTKITISYSLKDDPAAQAVPSPPAPIDKEAADPAPTASPKVYKVGGNVSAPRPIAAPDPPYTHQATKAHVEGTIVVVAVVNAKGEVVSVKEHSKPLGMGLDESAIHTIRTWKFKPGLRDGKPVAVKIMIQVTFHIFGDKKPAAAA